ncbi:hypothetical protein Q5H91_00300 [Sphingomonas sp. KR1UV-12]|uniref:Uncharacterized protein n=1 Tax=Sphingomonas aurea TaxID=3063994 RepID=A0ABT9EF95_9SPHN|nr:hypothetical protein [Sphingomonas sp. KR1UV-12]MDP1025641.1 hypothetical protein [Sphingomonas sp. KR1UV-12]
MRTIIFSRAAALCAMAIIGTSARAAEAEKSFVHEGYTYTYTTSQDAEGRTVIDGQRLPGRQDFHLIVENGRVSGRSGNKPVTFRVAEAKGAAIDASGSIAALGR